MNRIAGLVELGLFDLSHYPTKFRVYRPCGKGDKTYLICDHVSTFSSVIRLCGVQSLTLSYHCARFDANKSFWSGILWPHDQMQMILGKWELLNLSQHSGKFDTYRSFKRRDITILFCRVTSIMCLYYQKETWCDKWESFNVSQHWAYIDSYEYDRSEEMMLLFWHVTSCDHMIKSICDKVMVAPQPNSSLCHVWCLWIL